MLPRTRRDKTQSQIFQYSLALFNTSRKLPLRGPSAALSESSAISIIQRKSREKMRELCPSAKEAFLVQAHAEVRDTEACSTMNRSKESNSILFKVGLKMLLPSYAGIHTAKGRHVVNPVLKRGSNDGFRSKFSEHLCWPVVQVENKFLGKHCPSTVTAGSITPNLLLVHKGDEARGIIKKECFLT